MSTSAAGLVARWARWGNTPAGRWWFSRMLGRAIPYTGSIGATIEELRPGYARVRMPDRRRLRNHLGSVHAAALANVGELASGLALVSALPPTVRGIPVRLDLEYLAKARGRLEAVGRCDRPAVPAPGADGEATAVAEISDAGGVTVARATARWRLRAS